MANVKYIAIYGDQGLIYRPRVTHMIVQYDHVCSFTNTVTNGLPTKELSIFKFSKYLHSICSTLINPRRACAARVTVLGLSVCLSVCDLTSHLWNIHSSHKRYDVLNGQRRSENLWVFSETTALEIWRGSEKANMLINIAHRDRATTFIDERHS